MDITDEGNKLNHELSNKLSLADLPIEVIQEMALKYSPIETRNLCLTSKFFDNIICRSTEFWQMKIKHDFGIKVSSSMALSDLKKKWLYLKRKPKLSRKRYTAYNMFVIEYMYKHPGAGFPPRELWFDLSRGDVERYKKQAADFYDELEQNDAGFKLWDQEYKKKGNRPSIYPWIEMDQTTKNYWNRLANSGPSL